MSQTVSFKNIDPVPSSGTDFIDIVLSRTQRRLPTVVRPGFKISRIRAFYARKVKFTQESFTEKLDAILTQFPRLDAIHPFHADLVRSASGAG
jgi:nucleolar GTP-binding protein